MSNIGRRTWFDLGYKYLSEKRGKTKTKSRDDWGRSILSNFFIEFYQTSFDLFQSPCMGGLTFINCMNGVGGG